MRFLIGRVISRAREESDTRHSFDWLTPVALANENLLRGFSVGKSQYVYVMVQFYPWFNFYFPLFLCMVLYDN